MTSSNVRKLATRAGQMAGLPFPVHPHMLRHACGFKLANDGHDTRSLQHYLGHKNITHKVRYTELAPDRFKGFWNDWRNHCRNCCGRYYRAGNERTRTGIGAVLPVLRAR